MRSTFLFFQHTQFVPFHFSFHLLFLPILSSSPLLLNVPTPPSHYPPFPHHPHCVCSCHFPPPPPQCSFIPFSLLVGCNLACINRRMYLLDALSIGTGNNWPLTLKLIVLPGVTETRALLMESSSLILRLLRDICACLFCCGLK